MAGDIKEFKVNYDISSQGNAGDYFKKLSEQAANSQKTIANITKNITDMTSNLGRSVNNLKDAFKFEVVISTSKAEESLKELEKKTQAYAARIRKDIASALNGQAASDFKGTTAKAKKSVAEEASDLRKEIKKQNDANVALAEKLSKESQKNIVSTNADGLTKWWYKNQKGILTNLSNAHFDRQAESTQKIFKQLQEGIKTYNKLVKDFQDKAAQISGTSQKTPSTTPITPIVQQSKKELTELEKLQKVLDDKTKLFEEKKSKYDELIKKDNGGAFSYKDVVKDKRAYSGWITGSRYRDAFNAVEEAKKAKIEAFNNVRAEQAKQPKIVEQTKETSKAVAESAKETKKAVSETVTASEKGLTTLENLQKPTEALSAFFDKYGKKGGVTIKVHANITEAIQKINTLLSRIESQGAVIPVTLGVPGEPAAKSANSKAFSEVKGQLTEAGKQRKAAFNSLVEKQKNQTAKSAKVEEPGIVKQLTQTVSSLNSQLKKEPVKVYGAFDSTNLLGQLQTAMASLKEYAKANPILVNADISKAAASGKGSKAIPKGKKGTVEITKTADEIGASREKIQSKASEKPIIFRSSFNGGDAAFQANMSIQKIQKLVSEKPIILRSIFNGGDAAFQANIAMARIQKLVGEKPIIIRSSFNGGDAAFQAQQSLMKLQKLVDGKTIAVKGKLIGIEDATTAKKGGKKAITMPVNIKAEKLSSQINDIISDAKKAAGTKKGVTIQAKFSVKGITGKLSQLLKDLQAKANANPIKITAQFSNGDVIAQLNTTIGNLQKATEKLGKVVGSASKGRGRAAGTSIEEPVRAASRNESISRVGVIPMGNINERVYAPKQPSLYARMRASLYPFTGNTSFGARTPAMVEMAKGMGTMFAVGGAMSAVGSSLSQAVSYQNTMKTAQAILQNGTNDYTPSDFNTMTHTVRQVGKDTKFTAPDVANAARFMAMAGLHTKDITAAIRPVADVALIGDTDLGTTADKLTNVMTTFGLNAKQMRDIADIMTSTFTRSNTDMLMLAESAKYAGGIAHLYGKNFKNTFADTMALFGVLGNAGIQASSAGTTIRMMYQNLMQPNKKQLATLQKYNIYTRDKNGEPLEMRDILAQISAKVPQNKMADAIGQMFRITAQPGAAALASNMPMVTELIRANENAAGSGISQNIANEKKGTLAGLWARVTSSFTEAVVQAMENRQDKWAKMLGNVRDFLSDPETIKGISAIIDLVEVLAKTMMQFAKLWAGAYIKFPKIINFWLQVQMVMTQFGYLLTPIVQIVGLLNNFKGAILGVGGALGAVNKAAGVGGAVGIASGIGGIASSIGGTGWDIEDINPRRRTSPWSRFKNPDIFENLILGIKDSATLSSLRDKEAKYSQLADSFRNTLVHNDGRKEKLSPLWGYRAMGDWDLFSNTQKRKFMRQRQSEGHILKRFGLADELDERIDDIRSRIKAKMENLKEIRRPLQYSNLDLMTRYGSMTGNSAVLYAALKGRSHAERMSVAEGIFMRGGRNASLGLKMGFKEAFKNAKKFGSINAGGLLASMMTGIKTAFFGLMRGLATAVGFLVSPVGLAITAITALTAGLVVLYKHNKKLRDQKNDFVKVSERTNNNYKKYRQKVIEEADKATNGFKAVNIKLSSGIKPTIGSSQNKNYFAGNKIVPLITSKEYRGALSFAGIDPSIENNRYLAPETIALYHNAKRKPNKATGVSSYGGQLHGINENAKEAGIIAQWANIATQQPEIIKAVKEMRAAVAKGDEYTQHRLLERFTPDYLNSVRMTGSNMSAWQLSKIQDPSRYYEWQYAQFKYLQEAQMRASQANHYYRAVDMINGYNKLPGKLQNGYDATALIQQLIQSVPLVINNTPAAISLTKMGNIDWATLANTVNNGVPFTLQQQQEILANTYSAILDDPNIKNVAGIGDLLRVYLPKIADTRSQFDDFILGHFDLGTYASRQGHFGKPKINPNKTPKIPYRMDNMPIPPFYPNLGGIKYTGGSQFDKDAKKYGVTIATQMFSQRKGVGGNSSTTLKKNNRTFTNNRVVNHSLRPSVTSATSSPAVTNKKNKPGSQKDYASTYDRGAARPTQVNITIENLCRFDRTSINKDADSNAIAMAIENKISEAIAMLSSSALNTAGQTISQGLA